MGEKLIKLKFDDLDGSEDGVEEVTFYHHGGKYAVDLGEKHREELAAIQAEFDERMSKFLKVARKAGGNSAPVAASVRPTTTSTVDPSGWTASRRKTFRAEYLTRVRTWGRGQGKDIADKARVPQDVIDAYVIAHPEDTGNQTNVWQTP
ncbi:Lsr2 dimerization domain-containing protein [Longispora fulva]|uniref:Lsr2 dimerization domain-containing protein n=1 Tax=Longispora fulva TaxID=619741 RepID=A0A8J7GGI3_9ACTN|nr:histone-like nucleoid-structuring protein Lsr2 [Longispora fulva]MBG6140253.1 hypothetical protein [Longispora fulva]